MQSVLVPVDGSQQAEEAVDHADSAFPDAEIVLIHVIDPIDAGYDPESVVPGYSEDWYASREERAEELFEETRERMGREFETTVEVGRPARKIVEYAKAEDIDHIVMGSHGRSGVARILLGSVAETVVRRSPVPVTVVR
ncbi:MAG: universal stress protein [Halobacteriales archaeon]